MMNGIAMLIAIFDHSYRNAEIERIRRIRSSYQHVRKLYHFRIVSKMARSTNVDV